MCLPFFCEQNSTIFSVRIHLIMRYTKDTRSYSCGVIQSHEVKECSEEGFRASSDVVTDFKLPVGFLLGLTTNLCCSFFQFCFCNQPRPSLQRPILHYLCSRLNMVYGTLQLPNHAGIGCKSVHLAHGLRIHPTCTIRSIQTLIMKLTISHHIKCSKFSCNLQKHSHHTHCHTLGVILGLHITNLTDTKSNYS